MDLPAPAKQSCFLFRMIQNFPLRIVCNIPNILFDLSSISNLCLWASYQILKTLTLCFWSEFWRHRNNFTISDYYGPVISRIHSERTEILFCWGKKLLNIDFWLSRDNVPITVLFHLFKLDCKKSVLPTQSKKIKNSNINGWKTS